MEKLEWEQPTRCPYEHKSEPTLTRAESDVHSELGILDAWVCSGGHEFFVDTNYRWKGGA